MLERVFMQLVTNQHLFKVYLKFSSVSKTIQLIHGPRTSKDITLFTKSSEQMQLHECSCVNRLVRNTKKTRRYRLRLVWQWTSRAARGEVEVVRKLYI